MNKYIKVNVIIALIVAILGISCTKDEGNYDYVDINEVEFSGIKESYIVTRFDNLVITPELNFTKDEMGSGNYAYQWEAFEDDISGGTNLVSLSTEKDLDVTINLKPRGYFVYLTVTDLNSGIEFKKRFNLEVTNSIYEGWLVLSEVNGGSRLDMVSKLESGFTMFTDVLGGSDLNLVGTPSFVYSFAYITTQYGVYISTSGNGTTKIEPDTFDWVEQYGIGYEFIPQKADNFKVDNLVSNSGYSAYAMANGNAYFYYQQQRISYGEPINRIGSEIFSVSPMVGKGKQGDYMIFYDTTNKRFVRSRRGVFSQMPAAASTKFDYNNVGMDLIYMEGNDYNSTLGAATFAVLQDPTDSKYYLAYFNSANSSQVYFGEIGADVTDFDQASLYAVSPEYGYLYYTVGSKIYQYNFSAGITTLLIDKGAEEISLIKFHDFWVNSKYSGLSNNLIVGSYNPAGSEGTNGTMEFYSILELNAGVKLEASYSGFGKIKSVNYRER
ncbi:PKD-like family lipoprotein [Aestuariibaculum suncheonense]|uniref:PKD family protein n=1 Tax=Aestuariibaculum suncheonense TaxID=1028745 RepID=A0A8J6Q913_9FLAO|nr:PKD-like family lipoprotein [Aestuariibaculum suncheonense]MBD0836032.1 hypothetical protein [Aestuariibaculum suncheonense]